MNKIEISVIIPTKNSFSYLNKSLHLFNDFNEVIVIDSASNDGTKKLVEKYKYTYINFKWNGTYPKKRNWILTNFEFKNDWVLFLDSDEIINGAFIKEISKKIRSVKYNAYVVFFKNEFLGKILNWGDPFSKIALIRHKYCRYEIVNDNNWTTFDMEVHENILVNGKVGKIKNKLLHNSCEDLNAYINKHNEYAIWETERFLTADIKFKKFNIRRYLKYYLFSSIFLPYVYFFYSFFLRLGFLDGKHGYVFCLLKFSYFNNIRTRILASRLV